MQFRPFFLVGGVLALGACANQPPVPNDFDRIVASYETEIRQIPIGAMKPGAHRLGHRALSGGHDDAPGAMARTHRLIAGYRATNKAEEKRALTKEFNTLRVLEGMAFIQTDRLDDAARIGKEVRRSGLALGAREVTRTALMGLSFSALVSGWRDAQWFASPAAPGTPPRVTIAGSRLAVRRLLAAASCIDTLLDLVRASPRTARLSPSLVLWVVGAPPASGRGRDVLLGDAGCQDQAVVDYVARKRPIAPGTLDGSDVLYLGASAAIFRSWVAVVVAEGYCDRLGLAASHNCRALYVRPHLQAAAQSMADFLTPDERATDYCSAASTRSKNTRRERFALWYAWLRFNIRNVDGRRTC